MRSTHSRPISLLRIAWISGLSVAGCHAGASHWFPDARDNGRDDVGFGVDAGDGGGHLGTGQPPAPWRPMGPDGGLAAPPGGAVLDAAIEDGMSIDGARGELADANREGQDSAIGEPGCEDGKQPVCHVPPGNPERAHGICVAEPAIAAHLAHGDLLGRCEQVD